MGGNAAILGGGMKGKKYRVNRKNNGGKKKKNGENEEKENKYVEWEERV